MKPPRFYFFAVLLAIVATSLAGCASRTISLSKENTASRGVDPDGTPVLRSEKVHAVAVRPLHERFTDAAEGLPEFSVIVRNGGPTPIFFSPDNIAAFSGDRPVAVLAFGELRAKMLKEAQTAAARTALIAKDVADDGGSSSRDVLVTRPPIWDHVTPPKESDLNHILGAGTISPGELNGGVIKLNAADIQTGVPLRLVVTVSGEPCEFLFEVGN